MIQENITFKDSSGTNLVGVLSRSNDAYDAPVIICCHGFSSNKDRVSYTSLEKKLLDANFAVFRYDAFGHGESEGDLGDITLTRAVDGCIQAVKLLEKKGYKTIGLMGSSFGGCTVLNTAHILQEKIFAVCTKAPVSHYGLQKREKLGEVGIKEWKESGYTIYSS